MSNISCTALNIVSADLQRKHTSQYTATTEHHSCMCEMHSYVATRCTGQSCTPTATIVQKPVCIPSIVCCCLLFSAGPPFSYSAQQDEFQSLACPPDLRLYLLHQQYILAPARVGSDSKMQLGVHQQTNTLPVSSSCNLRCRSATVPVMFCAFFSSFCTDFEPVRTLASLALPARSVSDCMSVLVAGHAQCSHYLHNSLRLRNTAHDCGNFEAC